MAGSPLGEFLAGIPAQFGYAMNDDHVVAVGISREGRSGPYIVAEWDLSTAREVDLAGNIAEHIARIAKANPTYDRFVLVGYGPEGADRAGLLRTAVLATVKMPEPIVVHVNGNAWRLQIGEDTWTPAADLPDVSAQVVLAGLLAPVASRAELAARYEPLPTPTFGSINQRDAAVFESSPPSFRAEVATAALDKLTRPALDEPYQMAVLAHLTTTGPKAVRDAVMLAAAADVEHVAALVRAYQGAPEDMRPTMAAAAGTAMFLYGGGSVEMETILSHADRTGGAAHLTQLVSMSKRIGLNPHELRAQLVTLTKPALEEADTLWTAALSSKSFPKGVPTDGRKSTELPLRRPKGHSNEPQAER